VFGGTAYLLRRYYEHQAYQASITPLQPLIVEEMEAEEEERFVHPFELSPWYWQAYFKLKRVMFLVANFFPCGLVGSLMIVSDNPRLREYWLTLLVSSIETAGCSFQKLAQWVSMRPDMFPEDVIVALAHMRTDSPQHSFEHTREAIRASFGKEIEEIFEEFDSEPVASGSVAQVHRGRLRESYAIEAGIVGCEVAVKIRHPAVVAETFADMDILFDFMESGWLPTMVPFPKEKVVRMMQSQINLEHEALNLAKFSMNFRKECDAGGIGFPQVCTNLLSQGVLVESWSPGVCVENLSKLGENFQEVCQSVIGEVQDEISLGKKKLAEKIFDINVKMFLRDNLVHGDLHGGNLLVDDKGTCVVIDAGLVSSLSVELRPTFDRFLYSVCVGDTRDSIDTLLLMGHFRGDDDKTDVSLRAKAQKAMFESAIEDCLTKHVTNPMKADSKAPIELGDLFGSIFKTMNTHDFRFNGECASALMCMSLAEGVIRSLDPEFDVARRAVPYFMRYTAKDMVLGM